MSKKAVNTATNNSNRVASWDNIKGILILLVVFAHFLFAFNTQFVISGILLLIYTFHMPAFIFVSGYFGSKKASPLGIAKLVFAYIIFNGTMSLMFGYTNFLNPIHSYWYIIALIMWRLTADKVNKFKFAVPVTIIAGLLVGIVAKVDNTLALARFIAFYPFYIAGFKFASYEKKEEVMKELKSLKGVLSLLAGIVGTFVLMTRFRLNLNNTMMVAYSDLKGILIRFALYGVAACFIIALLGLAPTKKVPLITSIGRNSLAIFLVHRVITLYAEKFFSGMDELLIIGVSFVFTLILVAAFGNDYVAGIINRYLERGGNILLNCKEYFAKDWKHLLTGISAILVLLCFVVDSVFSFLIERGAITSNDLNNVPAEEAPLELVVPNTLSQEMEAEFNNAYRIVFAGDLILLEDQVKRGRNEDGTYCFDDVFEYARPYIESADFAIGVLEGPMAGEEYVYSEGNFDDGKRLHLNFPTAFGESIIDCGFDLVTTAGNHILDRGPEANIATINNLEEIGLPHIGTYRSMEEKDNNNVYFVEQNGMTFAVLAYTYGINNNETPDLINSDLSYCTSFIYGTEGELFETLKEEVRQDFEEAKAMNPDFIIVLPHYGTQFSNEPDEMQQTWNAIFKEYGADIILGDHAHVVEPVVISTNDAGENVFEAYCPGNFANIYRDDQGDTSALIEVYIDRDSKEIIGGGIVPLYTQSPLEGNYRALPIYDVMHNSGLRATLTTDDLARATTANDIITSVVFGESIDISGVMPRYLFDRSGYLRPVTTGLEITDEMREGTLWPLLESNDSICFIGDSITEGTANNGCPWYEPILEHLEGKTVTNVSRGGCNIQFILDNIDVVPSADLYVIAIGTNDVRHRNDETSAVDGSDFVNKINELSELLLAKNSNATLVFIAPWYSCDGDTNTPLTYEEKVALNNEFSTALGNYCATNGYAFIDVNSELRSILETELSSTYMVDFIHPNSTQGVILYSRLVLSN